MKHIIASSYESSILSEPTQYFMEIVQEYGAACFYGIITGGFGDCWFQVWHALNIAIKILKISM